MSHPPSIAPAGRYLLSVLQAEGPITYRRFYDHSPGRDREVAEGILAHTADGDEQDLDDFLEQGHVYVEWAAEQLADFGAIKTTPLSALLPDGEPDYRIELTDRGQMLAKESSAFKYHSLSSGFLGRDASNWLVVFAATNADEEETFQFDTVRDLGYEDGEVRVVDDNGNVYPAATRPYDWAFELALWHHFRAGDFLLTYTSPEQEKEWLAFCRKHPHLFRHDEFPSSCRTVNYRLSDRALGALDTIRRLGWFGRE